MRKCLSMAIVLGLVAAAKTEAAKPEKPPAIDQKDSWGLYNVSVMQLGASAKGTGASFNRDWPPNGTLQPGMGGGGTIINHPMVGSRIDIRLIVPVDIKAIEVVGLDYHGTRQSKGIDIFVDGVKQKHVELDEKPGQAQRIPLDAKGQTVGILITDEYPIRTLPDGKPGLEYGGWARLRVLSPTNVSELLKPVDNYRVNADPANIALTPAVEGKVQVEGQPRNTQGHPNTLWDKQDIAHYQDMLKTSKVLQDQYAGLKNAMDIRMTQPLGIPQPKQGPDGKWMHLSDKDIFQGKSYGEIHNKLGLDIANLGTVYALSGDAKYGEFCKKLLLAYADAYPNYGIGARPGFSHDPSKVFDQRLSDATWLIQVARGYDLIHDLPSITPEERKHIQDDLVAGNARHIAGNHATVEGPTNWSAIDTCAILTAGYACDDDALVNIAMYGLKGTKDKPTGGLLLKHFGPLTIDEDGLWAEGAMGYQFMAMEALVMDAEVLWHHGMDMYRYRNGAMKQLFDSPLRLAYPDLTTPATHDSGRVSIIGHDSFLYEYGYRRYRDPAYLAILKQIGTHLGANFQEFPVSVLYDRDPDAKAPPIESKSVNFFGVGYGILRNSTEAGTNSMLLEYGPNRSHGHPDKLTVDLYAFNDQLSPDPGIVWYELPLYRQWYRTTVAHNTLTVDEIDQVMAGAHQLTYGPAESVGIQRAWTGEAYPGVIMDRSLFLTRDYVADLFGAFARLPRKMDLAWHVRGDFASDLPLSPIEFPEPKENGYSALRNVRHGSTSEPWSAQFTRNGNVARLKSAGGTATEVIVGDGYLGREALPTVLERRQTGSTVYGNAIDISGSKDGYVKNVTQQGGLDAGYAALTIETPKGQDICFASYRPGTYHAGNMETDALQAMALMDGTKVSTLYLGGGTTLKVGDAVLKRDRPGLASIEGTETGGFVLANPSPSDATVTVSLAGMNGMKGFTLDSNGKRTGPSAVQSAAAGTIRVQLPASGRVEFAPEGAESLYDRRVKVAQARQDAQEAAAAQAREAAGKRAETREAEAKANPVPADTIVAVNAAAFSGQGNGAVRVVDNKTAAIGHAINGWDAEGHWLEWTVNVPADGYYNLSLCYCSQMDKIEREIQVNGQVQEPGAPLQFATTGGWAGNSDDWRLQTAMDPATQKPLLIKLNKGPNVIRLTNSNGRGINVNYLAVTSPDVQPTRELIAGKLTK